MLAIGRHHLDWGSVDQPPMAPLVAALTDLVAPGNVLVLRLPADRRDGRDRGDRGDDRARARRRHAGADPHRDRPGHRALDDVHRALAHAVHARAADLAADRVAARAVVAGAGRPPAARARRRRGDGGADEVPGDAPGRRDAGCRSRCSVRGRCCAARSLWGGVGIAAAIAAPTLVWQALNGWPQLRMGPIVAAEAAALYQGRPGIMIGLLASAGVMGVPLVLFGLWRLARDPALRDLRYLALTRWCSTRSSRSPSDARTTSQGSTGCSRRWARSACSAGARPGTGAAVGGVAGGRAERRGGGRDAAGVGDGGRAHGRRAGHAGDDAGVRRAPARTAGAHRGDGRVLHLRRLPRRPGPGRGRSRPR